MFDGEIEADESHLGGSRKGKRGRGAAGKVPVSGLLKWNERLIPWPARKRIVTLLSIIREQVNPDSVVYTDDYKKPWRSECQRI